ncbi:MAG: type II/IV secretion system protein [Candidatus Berkelbacteria bacterium]|nr:type II/IV secretion system protein [Candidatus Berkelbacteria bacterium]
MASQKKNFTPQTSLIGDLTQALSSQSIIDVFVIQGLVTPADAEKIKAKYKNNLAIERFLLSNKLLSREAINKAYSIILKLPFISLAGLAIPDEIKNLIPANVERKFFLVPFAKKNNLVSVAIGAPGEIFLAGNRNLSDLNLDGKNSIELFISTPEDIAAVLAQKSAGDLRLSQGSLPVIFLRNRNFEMKNLKLLPLDFIIKNRVAIFDQVSEKVFRLAEEDPESSKTKKIVEFLKSNNKIDFEEFSTSSADIDYIISLYSREQQPPTSSTESEPEDNREPGTLSEIFGSLSKGNQPEITIEKLSSKETTPLLEMPKPKPKSVEIISDDSPSGEQPETTEERTRAEISAARKDDEEERDIGRLLGADIKDLPTLENIIKENSIPKLVAATISYALYLGSSDIHIEPETKRLRIRFRIDGVLKDIFELPIEFLSQVVSRVKILGLMKLDETRIPQDGRFSVNFRGREVDVRVSMLPTVFGEKVVLRILDKSQGILSLEDLGFVGSSFKIIMEEIRRPYGIILATGPTGSGKSTTLYAILNRINQPGVNVVTLEDPVEYEIPGVNQCQIKPKIGFTFAEGLRSVLRQDPNIIMVGEVRDSDTAAMATHAALTGHLVLTTLHTNDAATALPRFINMGIEPYLITSSVNLIIAQRLIRRVCVKCREKTEIPPALKAAIEKELVMIPKVDELDLARAKKPVQFYKGRGCAECSDGFRGRIGIYELLRMNEEIENLAVSKRPAAEIKESAIKSGMLSMRQDGILKALDGLTTIDEVMLATGEFEVGGNLLTENQPAENSTTEKISAEKPAV